MSYVSIRTFMDNKRILPPLLSLDEAAAEIKIASSRLLELTNAELTPCVRVDGGAPQFFKIDLIAWAKAHLYKIQEGKALTRPFIIHVGQEKPEVGSLPKELRPMAEHIYAYRNPIESCVYFLCRGDSVVYVGQSVNLPSRLYDHLGSEKDFDRVFYVPVPESELGEVEGTFIRALRPPMNGLGSPVPTDPASVLTRMSMSHLVGDHLFKSVGSRNGKRPGPKCGLSARGMDDQV